MRLTGLFVSQAFGTRAKQAASALVFGKEVILETHGKDKYGRTLPDVFLLDGTHVNHTLVKDGWCWWYRKYAPGDTVSEGIESETRAGQKGCGLIRIQCRLANGGRVVGDDHVAVQLLSPCYTLQPFPFFSGREYLPLRLPQISLKVSLMITWVLLIKPSPYELPSSRMGILQ